VPQVLDPLLSAWHRLVRDTGARTVVRSSALTEDQAGSTFAGQFETFLGLENEADFLTAVRACWAALWSPRALRYMAMHDMNPADTAMGLCVQTLVQARMSGGGMSQMADGNMSLSATWGLGTTIAQGEVVPDRYVLSSDTQLLETVAGRKEHSVLCTHHHDRRVAKSRPAEVVAEPCLDESQAIELGRMMKRAEHLLGVPVEIEWARDDFGFRMLQARPLQMEPAQVPDEMWTRRPGLRGQPSGIGWGSGRACVVNCECELSRIAPGDVLVTKIASPALNEVLPRVAGVVAELGGSTSHLASLARERGIPMVLGVLEATTKIPDGVQIGVDGVIGMVRWQH
jgi:pyruvate,water dikinase